jgi:hypothetical protein
MLKNVNVNVKTWRWKQYIMKIVSRDRIVMDELNGGFADGQRIGATGSYFTTLNFTLSGLF